MRSAHNGGKHHARWTYLGGRGRASDRRPAHLHREAWMKQPALAAGGFSSLLTLLGAIAVHYGWMATDEVALWIPLLTMLGTMGAAWWAAHHSVGSTTLHDAGTSAEQVKAVAADPNRTLVSKFKS